jgi:hypothetical protein
LLMKHFVQMFNLTCYPNKRWFRKLLARVFMKIIGSTFWLKNITTFFLRKYWNIL